MEMIQKRQSSRWHTKAPIIITDNPDGCYHGASVVNISSEGMYFETDQAFAPESELWIKLILSLPETSGSQAYNDFHAHVKHCRPIGSNGHKFGIGVQYTRALRMVRCDLCNCKVYHEQAHKVEDMIHMCSDCYIRLENLPDDQIRASIEDYLMCNII